MDQYNNLFSPSQIDGRLPKAMQVYELLRSAIISMKFRPGSAIQEKEICAQLGISRTPLREAILQLQKESLVSVIPSGGTFVNKIILREVLEGQLIRDTVEMRLTRLAARNYKPEFTKEFDLALFRQKSAAERKDVDEFFGLDNEFHKLICACAGFPNLWLTIHNATGQLDRVRRHAFPLENHYLDVLNEHTSMSEALKKRDEDSVAAVFQDQLDSTFTSLELLKKADPELIQNDKDVSVADIR